MTTTALYRFHKWLMSLSDHFHKRLSGVSTNHFHKRMSNARRAYTKIDDGSGTTVGGFVVCVLNRNCPRSVGAEDLSDRRKKSASKVKISKRSGVKVTSLIVKLPKTWFEPQF
jgi:hypothetical protein